MRVPLLHTLSSLFMAALPWAAVTATAQTDYYNTDAARPLRVEDAYPIERLAFELQLAPLRLERGGDGHYHWALEPGLAYGVLTGTEIEAALHLQVADGVSDDPAGSLGGIELSILHNLNVETAGLPALAVGAATILPVGSSAPDRIYPAVRGVATRTFRWARVHVNGSYALGESVGAGHPEVARWMGGVAVDRAFPLQSALLMADVFVEQPIWSDSELEWTAEGGARYQLGPAMALDIGIGRRFTGSRTAWFVTIGAGRSFGIRSLTPPLGEE